MPGFYHFILRSGHQNTDWAVLFTFHFHQHLSTGATGIDGIMQLMLSGPSRDCNSLNSGIRKVGPGSIYGNPFSTKAGGIGQVLLIISKDDLSIIQQHSRPHPELAVGGIGLSSGRHSLPEKCTIPVFQLIEAFVNLKLKNQFFFTHYS